MIFLTQSATTYFPVTLFENTTITGTPYSYLFNFISDDTLANYYFTTPDLSTSHSVFNYFAVTLTGSAYVNLTAGTINLPTQGYYHYKIYQQTGNTNVALSGLSAGYTQPIEYGKVLVTGTSLNQTIYTYTSQTQTFVYNN